LAQDTKPTAQQKNLLEKARVCADSVNGLITNLLDFSMLEGGSFKLKPQLFNLRNSLQFQLSMLGPLAAKQDITLNYFFHDQSRNGRKHQQTNYLSSSDAKAFELFVMGDWLRLQQILTNLVTNSIKYSQAGSEVTVTCSFTYDDDGDESETILAHKLNPTFNNNNNNNNNNNFEPNDSEEMFLRFRRPSMNRAPDAVGFVTLDIVVEDRGIGIPAEEIPKIFSAFYQGKEE